MQTRLKRRKERKTTQAFARWCERTGSGSGMVVLAMLCSLASQKASKSLPAVASWQRGLRLQGHQVNYRLLLLIGCLAGSGLGNWQLFSPPLTLAPHQTCLWCFTTVSEAPASSAVDAGSAPTLNDWLEETTAVPVWHVHVFLRSIGDYDTGVCCVCV